MTENVLAVYEPTTYRVEKLDEGKWRQVSDYGSEQAARDRARDIAQIYRIKARILLVPRV